MCVSVSVSVKSEVFNTIKHIEGLQKLEVACFFCFILSTSNSNLIRWSVTCTMEQRFASRFFSIRLDLTLPSTTERRSPWLESPELAGRPMRDARAAIGELNIEPLRAVAMCSMHHNKHTKTYRMNACSHIYVDVLILLLVSALVHDAHAAPHPSPIELLKPGE